MGQRVVTVMGDGGFWHNGLTSGVANAVFRRRRSPDRHGKRLHVRHRHPEHSVDADQAAEKMSGISISEHLRGVGVEWLKRVTTYKVAEVAKS